MAYYAPDSLSSTEDNSMEVVLDNDVFLGRRVTARAVPYERKWIPLF